MLHHCDNKLWKHLVVFADLADPADLTDLTDLADLTDLTDLTKTRTRMRDSLLPKSARRLTRPIAWGFRLTKPLPWYQLQV